jgi:hypothetical protein
VPIPPLRTRSHESRRPDTGKTLQVSCRARSRFVRRPDSRRARYARHAVQENRRPPRFDTRRASGLSEVVNWIRLKPNASSPANRSVCRGLLPPPSCHPPCRCRASTPWSLSFGSLGINLDHELLSWNTKGGAVPLQLLSWPVEKRQTCSCSKKRSQQDCGLLAARIHADQPTAWHRIPCE